MKRTVAAQFVLAAALLAGACGGDDEPSADAATPPDARPPAGTMSLTWRIERGGVVTSCTDAGAQFVEVQMVRQGEGAGEADNFNCAAGEATTREVEIGIYDLRFDLLDGQGDSLLAARLEQFGIDVSENGDTPLGEIVFELP
jgi:hypothetical protein